MSNASPEPDLRRLILDTSRHLLVRSGYRALSMRNIARAIGYSATSIYLHFENKDALFRALIDEGMERLYTLLEQEASIHVGRPVQCLRGLCRRYVAFGLEHAEYYEIMFLLQGATAGHDDAAAYRGIDRSLAVFEQALRAGHREGSVRAPNPGLAAACIWSSLHGLVSLLLADRIVERPEDFIASAVDQMLSGFLAETQHELATPG